MRKTWGSFTSMVVISGVKLWELFGSFSHPFNAPVIFPNIFRVFSQTISTIIPVLLSSVKCCFYPFSTNLITIKINLNTIYFSGRDWRII